MNVLESRARSRLVGSALLLIFLGALSSIAGSAVGASRSLALLAIAPVLAGIVLVGAVVLGDRR